MQAQLTPKTLASRVVRKQRQHYDDWQQFVYEDVVDFFEANHVYDPELAQPLALHPEQKIALRALSQRDEQTHNFKHNVWVYSAPKKSGKTTVTAGVVLWQAWRLSNGYVAIVANDLKQADSRMFRVIEYIVKHHPEMRKFAKINRYKIILSNGTIIEALPVDASGEAGMNPTCIAWTEVWGAKGNRAEMMWSETALAPNRAGQSFKLVESYAGHSGESLILERLYEQTVKQATHIDTKHEIYSNPLTGMIAYWCTRRIMPWQDESDPSVALYYASERADNTLQEYTRKHDNAWVTSVGVFVQPKWWNACAIKQGEKLNDGYNGIVIGIDAAVNNDCFAIVGVAREDDMVHVVFTKVWTPPVNGEINFFNVENVLIDYLNKYHVVCVTYDPYQMKYMADRVQALGLAWIKEFKQGTLRLEADKALQDRIRSRKLLHGKDATLTTHVLNANAKVDEDATKLRIVKRSDSMKIDACVALSMACYLASELNIG